MVKVVRGNKSYMLDKKQFCAYMFNLWKTAQTRKQAKQDYIEEKKGEKRS